MLWGGRGRGGSAKVLEEDIFIQLKKFAQAPHMVPGAVLDAMEPGVNRQAKKY